MSKKVTPLLIEKYDITNKIFNEIADLEARYVLLSIIKEPKTVLDISQELSIPVSSTYKKIHDLLKSSLIQETHRDFTSTGKIIKYYQSRVKDIQIHISKFEPIISFKKNSGARN